MIAGGVKHKFRNAGTRHPEFEPPGVCEHLGIELKFTQPHNPGAKIPESKFAKWSRSIDTRPEFAGAHAGHHPGDKPDGEIMPVPIELVEQIYRREMAKDNARTGRRTQNSHNGESYDQTFERLLKGRIKRPMMPKQRWRASLLYQVRKVDRLGQVRANGWVYGKDCEDGSQELLLPYEGLPILIGTDPSNYAAPAIAYDMDTRREIMAGIQPDIAGDYDDMDGARKAGRERKRLAKMTRQIDAKYRMDLTAHHVDLNDGFSPDQPGDPRDENVVRPEFSNPIQKGRKPDPDREEMKRDFWDRHLAAEKERKASGGDRQPSLMPLPGKRKKAT